MHRRWVIRGAILALLAWLAPLSAQGPGTVKSAMKVSERSGGIAPLLETNDQLGRGIALIGDLDGDGVPEVASAGHTDDDGGLDCGAVYVFFLRRDGRSKAFQKISMLEGGFIGPLREGDQMGRAMAGLGDLDGDGVPDLAVGANFDRDGGKGKGAVWILFLNRNGTVKGQAKISALSGLTGLDFGDQFGRGLASLGDLDKDGIPDLAVAAPYDDDGGENKGAVYILTLTREGRIKTQRKISQLQGGFRGRLLPNDVMGFALCNLGDFDGNGVIDLVAGANLDDDGALNAGAIWLLFLNPDGSVLREQKISALSGGFTGVLESPDQFGDSVAAVGDLNGDGRTEIAVGAVKDGDGGKERGATWILFPNADGTVAFHQKISALEGRFPYRLDNIDWLGSALCPLGDLNLDGFPDLAIGARNDDDGGPNKGAFYVTFLNGGAQAAMTAGRGPTQGSIRFASGAPALGEHLGLALEAPSAAGDALPYLVVGRRSLQTRTGLALDPHGWVGARFGREELALGTVLDLTIPRDPALAGETIWVEARWIDGEGRQRGASQPLELLLTR
jgi:hypothetical protein